MAVSTKELTKSTSNSKSDKWSFFQSAKAVQDEPSLIGYAHHIIRAFDVLKLSTVWCIDNRPTIYFRRSEEPISWQEANQLQRIFWNQGIATILILADPSFLRIYSGQARPADTGDASEQTGALVPSKFKDIVDLVEMESLLHQVASGQYYTIHSDHFNSKQAVDEYLLRNLAAARDRLITGEEKIGKEVAHGLLGRLIFLCYLTDRDVIDWKDYESEVGKKVKSIQDLLNTYDAKEGLNRLYDLLGRLQRTFNGSMFDQDLESERRRLKPIHYETLRLLFSVGDVAARQDVLPFSVYNFNIIPVETISAIYEDFLNVEDAEGKKKKGAYYTPRHLAEMVVETAIAKDSEWYKRRYLDSSCGSGIFLVILFNRIASYWIFSNPHADYKRRADALLRILHTQLCGVDIDSTACGIACFSLYLAFLDHFEPRDLREFAVLAHRGGRKVLPKLLRYRNSPWREDHTATIFETDFFSDFFSNLKLDGFDYSIGNPPWQGRGTKQIAWRFMENVPRYLKAGGHGILLLPAKVLLNKTDLKQQSWFRALTVERVINLSDFRRILFERAKCPAVIIRFAKKTPTEDHRIEYITPRVTGTDSRDGVVTIFPRDKKRLKQLDILNATTRQEAPAFWKRNFSATPRDLRLLDLLDAMPRLNAITKSPDREDARTIFFKGVGIKPNGPDKDFVPWWNLDRRFLSASSHNIALFVFDSDCEKVGRRFHPKVHRVSDPKLFEPPLVVVSQGFGKAAFCDFPVLFRHFLRSITVASQDPRRRKERAELLLFLTVYLRSRLANYYLFHTATSWGTERDQVHLFELLGLPFPVPGDEYAHPKAEEIIKKVAAEARVLKSELERDVKRHAKVEPSLFESDDTEPASSGANQERQKKIDAFQARQETQIYRYFDLTEEEIALVEDTVKITEPSSTPESREIVRRAGKPSLRTVKDSDLKAYALMITQILNAWSEEGQLKVESSAIIFGDKPFVLFHLKQTKSPKEFRLAQMDSQAQKTFERIFVAATEKNETIEYPRTVMWFDGPSIYLLKPANLLHWTRTAALNDADEIFAKVVRQRRAQMHE